MRPFAPLAVALSIALAGCANEAARTTHPVPPTEPMGVPGDGADGLKSLAGAYMSFQEKHGRPPKSFGELGGHSLDVSRPLPPGVQSLTVFWGAGMGRLARDEKPAEVVIAHATATGDTIPVLMADGTTKTMTASEFGTAKWATPLEK